MINAGYKVAYVAEARVIHSHNYTGMQQFHRNFDMAVSQAEHPEVFEGIKSESEGIKTGEADSRSFGKTAENTSGSQTGLSKWV